MHLQGCTGCRLAARTAAVKSKCALKLGMQLAGCCAFPAHQLLLSKRSPNQCVALRHTRLSLCVCVPASHSCLQDVYDKKRQGLIKQLKADALAWTSKYARGGSVRAQSAREV